ncbi:methylated-DNA--[protein]-cysteine S-methyltransferase [Paenibacillus sp. CAU 1782]
MNANLNMPAIQWSLLRHGDWNLHLAANEAGLCFIGSQDAPLEELQQWLVSRYPGRNLEQNDNTLESHANALISYLDGSILQPELKLHLKGTPFQEAVWQALCDIPYGHTRSYSDIAETIGKPKAVRAVGTAIGANPLLIVVPCHRVIGKNGALTGYRGGMEMKTKLLELERGTRRL